MPNFVFRQRLQVRNELPVRVGSVQRGQKGPTRP